MDDTTQQTERASTGFIDFMNVLGPEERKELTAALREPNNFLAGDMTDVLAILKTLKKQPE